MKHKHVGGPHVACTLCFEEAQQEVKAEDERSRRFWAYVIVGFSLALAGVTAFVLFRIGMGR